MKEHLSFTDDLGTIDDALIGDFLEAAEAHIDRLLGFKISATYGGDGQPPAPADLCQAVKMLAAHYYDNREGMGGGVEAPFAVTSIVREHRGFTF